MSEDNLKNYINANLQFTEYKPVLVEAEEKAAVPPSNSKIQKQVNSMGEFKIIDHASAKSQKLENLLSPVEVPDDIHDILMEKVD